MWATRRRRVVQGAVEKSVFLCVRWPAVWPAVHREPAKPDRTCPHGSGMSTARALVLPQTAVLRAAANGMSGRCQDDKVELIVPSNVLWPWRQSLTRAASSSNCFV